MTIHMIRSFSGNAQCSREELLIPRAHTTYTYSHIHTHTHAHNARGRVVEARWRLLSCLPSGTSSTGIVRILLSRVHACTCEHNAAQHTTRRTSYNFGYVIARVGD